MHLEAIHLACLPYSALTSPPPLPSIHTPMASQHQSPCFRSVLAAILGYESSAALAGKAHAAERLMSVAGANKHGVGEVESESCVCMFCLRWSCTRWTQRGIGSGCLVSSSLHPLNGCFCFASNLALLQSTIYTLLLFDSLVCMDRRQGDSTRIATHRRPRDRARHASHGQGEALDQKKTDGILDEERVELQDSDAWEKLGYSFPAWRK
jgi:hypothetical protein